MVGLNSQLNTIGISAAKGVDLVMQRDQMNGTLPTQAEGTKREPADTANKRTAAKKELTAEQLRQIDELRNIDRKVRAHEQAHISAGADLITSGPSYTYTYGPDGKQYAVAGEVGIDTSAEKEPAENIDKGQRIQATALAPSDPSPQDHRVASLGSQLERQGRSDLIRTQREEQAAASERRRVENAYAVPAADAGGISVLA